MLALRDVGHVGICLFELFSPGAVVVMMGLLSSKFVVDLRVPLFTFSWFVFKMKHILIFADACFSIFRLPGSCYCDAEIGEWLLCVWVQPECIIIQFFYDRLLR